MRWWLELPTRWQKVYTERGWKGFLRYLITPPRRLAPTKAGWIFFLFMILIVTFGYSTGNNLLFLLFSAMLSMMAISGIMSEASLGEIEVHRDFPDRIFARRSFILEYSMRNLANRMPASALYVRDTKLFDKGLGPYIVQLPAKGKMSLRSRARIMRRGKIRLTGFDLTTSYPFLLFRKTRGVRDPRQLLVYPAIHPIKLSVERLFASGEGSGRTRQGEGDSFSTIREYVEGEPLRMVDWKKSARSDSLYLKQFDRHEAQKVGLRFDPGKSVDYEKGLETCASLLLWLHEKRIPFALSAGGKADTLYSDSERHLKQALTRLALYDKPQTPPTFAEVKRVLEVDADGSFRIR